MLVFSKRCHNTSKMTVKWLSTVCILLYHSIINVIRLLEVSECELFYYRWLMCLLIILPAVNRWAILNSVSQ
jgi:hypothetical protein